MKERAKRLFVFDVDGTLLPYFNDELPPDTVNALNALLAEGDAICIASGRPFQSIHELLSRLEAGEKYAGIANGSVLRDYEGNLLFGRYLRLGDLDYFVEKYRKDEDLSLYAYSQDDVVLCYKQSRFTKSECDVNGMSLTLLHGNEDKDTPISKIMVAALTKGKADTLSLTKEELRRFDATRSGPDFFEIIPKGVSKGAMTEVLRQHLGIDKDNVYCFGDSRNDLEMVSMFHGIAMGNACAEVKAVAEHVTRPCHEGGIAFALKEILGFVD